MGTAGPLVDMVPMRIVSGSDSGLEIGVVVAIIVAVVVLTPANFLLTPFIWGPALRLAASRLACFAIPGGQLA